ncbi:hypothetical protein BDZ94DRAFT_1253049 [Collybia nuda]|uniref:Uncharacterized protein n=1 Tax=Collybia nuda TaxID=64659 RepID=A0A9P5YD90_9AGAR|nr:hypothetical protein BDZ94DRAFT_1253049 [Collybia nuda]
MQHPPTRASALSRQLYRFCSGFLGIYISSGWSSSLLFPFIGIPLRIFNLHGSNLTNIGLNHILELAPNFRVGGTCRNIFWTPGSSNFRTQLK